MHSSEERAIAIVGVGAILPDAPSAADFWNNIVNKKYSITEVPPERWRAADYYDPDPGAADKTYTTIGGWVRGFEFDWRRFRMPPKMAAAMDAGQQWAVTIAAEALQDYGYPERPLNTENTAVILGTATGGELHYTTHERIIFPEFANALQAVKAFNQLPANVQEKIISQWHEQIDASYPTVTEDSMPGELPNIVSGRVANILNLRGPNFITDAACASTFAAINAAIELLVESQVDAVLAGGVDHTMGISSFVKFCKIGALSATGSRPFGEGADGFVMGEGSAVFLLKRLEDAERNGDKIYAVIRGVGGASDGKGKGITAPNPVGQELAVQRAWENGALDPATATLIEAHGTSTRVGDVVEVESLNKVFGNAAQGSIGLGSAKSNIGHLKAGAGAAGLLKATMALHHKILPPTLNAERPNPHIDLAHSPFYLIHEAQEWRNNNNSTPRRCGVSAYGFGGTNFHLVLEEHTPGSLTQRKRRAVVARPQTQSDGTASSAAPHNYKPAPVRGILALGSSSPMELEEKLEATIKRVEGGWSPPKSLLPKGSDIEAEERLIIDFANHAQLLDRVRKARKVMGHDNPQAWKAIEAQGIFRGSGKPKGKIAFLFPGQGSQYVNMGRDLAELSPVVAELFAEADEVMMPILGQPLTDYVFVDPDDSKGMMRAEFGLMQTEITQPAMLMLDIAIMKLLAQYGFEPDMVMGHSLGEYAGLIAAGIMPFADALEATAARGSEMSKVSLEDNGKMAAIIAPYDEVMATLEEVDGYVIPANINSHSQCVIGGASDAVEEACALFEEKGYRAILIPVSHAFHTAIVAPASEPLREVLDRLRIYEPQMPLVANLTGDFYPQTPDEIKDVLQQQVASTVQWVKGLETLYDAGVRTFVEVGPKRALRGFARDVFSNKDDVTALMTIHPKTGDLPTFNQALCGLYAAGYKGENGAASVTAVSAAETTAAAEVKKGTALPDQGGRMPSMEALSEMITQAVQQGMRQAASAPPLRMAPAALQPAPEPVQVAYEPPAEIKQVGVLRGEGRVARDMEPEAEGEPALDSDIVAAKIIALVAEQTGYPEDMLDLDLDMEADLGIDTVKQAETFAAIQEEFDIPMREDLTLRDYDTLEKVIAFVHEMRPDLAAAVAAPVTTIPAVEPIPAAEPGQDSEAGSGDPVAAKIIGLVAEQTGYPEDMLDLDLDMEADLGIDTVKQAETFAAIQEEFDIPMREDLTLRDYDTLEKVIAFVYEMRPDLKGMEETGDEQAPAPAETAETKAGSKYRLEDADKMPRRVPAPSMRPSLSLCKGTGVQLDGESRVIIMPDGGGVAKELLSRLQGLGVTVLMLDADLAGESLVEQLATWREEGGIQGIYWLPALDVEPALNEMGLDGWRQGMDQRVKKLYRTMRTLYESINRPGTFLVAATRLGGLFGYGSEGATAPMGGAVAGFSKAFNIEQSLRSDGQGPLVKVVDFEVSRETAFPASLLIAETLSDPGIVEVGYYEDNRYTITLSEQPAADGRPGMELGPETVFLVTGAAGGITSEIVADLAAASQGVFYLLDLVEAPAADDPSINLFRSDRDGLKRQLIEEARARGERPTPVEIEKEMGAIERSEAALRAVEAVQEAGGTAFYRSVNLLDGEAITAVVDEIRQRYGRIDVLIHAGGLLVDRTLPNKEPEQFDLVFDVKADGFFNIMHAAQDMPMGAAVCFSSVAGRFGNNGQSDYSAANDLLCKLTSSMRRWRPETKSIAIDWTAWGEIGMAARGSVPTVMKALGIDMLTPESGVPTVRRELVAGGFKGEILVAGALGIMTEENDESGGLDVKKAKRWLQENGDGLLMVGEIKAAKLYGGLQVETTLDPAEQPFLFDHAPDEDTPWLPGVMATETLAELATLFAPGYAVAAVENEQMMGAFKFFRNKPRTLYLSAVAKPAANGELVVQTILRSLTEPAREGQPARVQEHFSADIRLAKADRENPTAEFDPPDVESLPTTAEEVYQVFFHGPAYQVLERIRVEDNRAIALMAQGLPANYTTENARSLMAPRLVELCFQAAAQWCIEAKNSMALPLGFGELKVYREAADAEGQRLYALVETKDEGQTFDADVVDESGAVYVSLREYRTVSRPGAA